MAGRVEMRDSIVIEAPDTAVFDFISDGTKDPQWRTEVDRMDIRGERALGTVMTEYSSFYRFLHTVTPTEIKRLEPPTRFVLETPESNPTWLRSIRTVEPVGDGRTRFTYELAFDLEAMKQISPVLPPGSLVAAWYRRRIRRYLRNAKRLIETAS
ncbi:SRPBCC family protein [Streptomyces sp. NPDC101490]|uniref:SRPBCC family protein n=1 Tax=Streptomyces sp. NPDC101490 TaxID=3366143 RepID=UPI0038281BAD